MLSVLKQVPLKHRNYYFINPRVLPLYCGCREKACRVCAKWYRMMDVQTNNWRDRLTTVFKHAAKLAEGEGSKLSVHPHPHRFRHTFAKWLLHDLEMDVKDVAEYLGDKPEVVRRHYYKYCVADRKKAINKFQRTAHEIAQTPPLIDVATPPWPGPAPLLH